jgi:hypothetical protein
LEIEALCGAAEEVLDRVERGIMWQNEEPQTISALRRSTKKLLAACCAYWDEDSPKETP